ncbi:MAG: hypothetical protein KGL39_59460, partial [Patescibacteria group bacterium]|nr:hypothetical protein [Patescibacteria group bacterium]
AKKRAEVEAQMLRKQTEEYTQQGTSHLAEARGQILDLVLERADVSAFSKAFEERSGKNFRDAVIEYGESVYYTRKDAQGRPVDLSPQQAVKDLMEQYGKFMGQNQAQSAEQPAEAAVAPQAKKPPVIPNVAAKQGSPTGQVIKSIDELRALSRKMNSKQA